MATEADRPELMSQTEREGLNRNLDKGEFNLPPETGDYSIKSEKLQESIHVEVETAQIGFKATAGLPEGEIFLESPPTPIAKVAGEETSRKEETGHDDEIPYRAEKETLENGSQREKDEKVDVAEEKASKLNEDVDEIKEAVEKCERDINIVDDTETISREEKIEKPLLEVGKEKEIKDEKTFEQIQATANEKQGSLQKSDEEGSEIEENVIAETTKEVSVHESGLGQNEAAPIQTADQMFSNSNTGVETVTDACEKTESKESVLGTETTIIKENVQGKIVEEFGEDSKTCFNEENVSKAIETTEIEKKGVMHASTGEAFSIVEASPDDNEKQAITEIREALEGKPDEFSSMPGDAKEDDNNGDDSELLDVKKISEKGTLDGEKEVEQNFQIDKPGEKLEKSIMLMSSETDASGDIAYNPEEVKVKSPEESVKLDVVENVKNEEKNVEASNKEVLETSDTARTGESIAHEANENDEGLHTSLPTLLVKEGESLQEGENVTPAQSSEEKKEEDKSTVIAVKENISSTRLEEGNQESQKERLQHQDDMMAAETEPLNLDENADNVTTANETVAIHYDEEMKEKVREEKNEETVETKDTKVSVEEDTKVVEEASDANEAAEAQAVETLSTTSEIEVEKLKKTYELDLMETTEGKDVRENIEEQANKEDKEEGYGENENAVLGEISVKTIISKEQFGADIAPQYSGEETVLSHREDEVEEQTKEEIHKEPEKNCVGKDADNQATEEANIVEDQSIAQSGEIVIEDYVKTEVPQPEIVDESGTARTGENIEKNIKETFEDENDENSNAWLATSLVREREGLHGENQNRTPAEALPEEEKEDVEPTVKPVEDNFSTGPEGTHQESGKETLKVEKDATQDLEKSVPGELLEQSAETVAEAETFELYEKANDITGANNAEVIQIVEETKGKEKKEETEDIHETKVRKAVVEENTKVVASDLKEVVETENMVAKSTVGETKAEIDEKTYESVSRENPVGEEMRENVEKKIEEDIKQGNEDINNAGLNDAIQHIKVEEHTGTDASPQHFGEETAVSCTDEAEEKARKEVHEEPEKNIVDKNTDKKVMEEANRLINQSAEQIGEAVAEADTKIAGKNGDDGGQIIEGYAVKEPEDLASLMKGAIDVEEAPQDKEVIDAKPEDASNLVEKVDQTIPAATDKAEEETKQETKTEPEMQGNENPKELMTIVTTSGHLQEDDLQESSTFSSKEFELNSGEASEIIDDIPEKDQTTHENAETIRMLQERGSVRNEDETVNATEVSGVGSVDSGIETITVNVQPYEDNVSSPRDGEMPKVEKTRDLVDQEEICKSETFDLQHKELPSARDDDLKGMESTGADRKKTILGEEDTAKISEVSLEEAVIIQEVAVGHEAGDHKQQHEPTETNNCGTLKEENLELAVEEQTCASERVTSNQIDSTMPESIPNTVEESRNVGLDQSSKSIAQMSQESQAEIEKKAEQELGAEGPTTKAHNTEEMIKTVILAEKVNKEVQRADGDENAEETKEKDSDLKEIHTIPTAEEGADKVKETSATPTEFLQVKDSNEQTEIVNLDMQAATSVEKETFVSKDAEGEKVKDEGIESPAVTSLAPTEESREMMKEIMEEAVTCSDETKAKHVTDTVPVIGLEEAPIDDKKVHVSSLTFGESIPQELAYGTNNLDGIALEESSSHLPSRLATGDHDNVTSEKIVPQSSVEIQQVSEGIEELAEGEVTTDQEFPEEISKENHNAGPLALSPQKEDHEAKGAIEHVEENTAEMVTRKDESLDGANAEIAQTSDAVEQKKKEGSECIPKSSEGIGTTKEEGTTSIQGLNVENIEDQYQTWTSELLLEYQEHGTLATTVSTEQNTDKLEVQEDTSKATEETSLPREETKELEVPQIVVQLNKDIQKESEKEAHEEEGMAPYKIEEETEKEVVSTSDSQVFESEGDGLITSAQTPVEEQSEGQQSKPSSALYGEDQVHETSATTVSMEDTVKEVLEDESKTAREASLQMDEPKELEIPHLELPPEKDKQDKNPNEVHEREILGFESETSKDIQKDTPDAHVEEATIPKVLELHPQEYESKKSISEYPTEFDKSTEVTRPLEGTSDLGTKTSEEVLKSVSEVHDHKILDETEKAGTKKKDPDAATNGHTVENLTERTTDTTETIHNDITNEESVEEKKDDYISHPITLVEEATKESSQEYKLKTEESPAEETTALTIHKEELYEEIETGEVDAETKTVENFQQTAVENETFKEEKGQETSRKEGPEAFAEESAATLELDQGENISVANSEQQIHKEAEPCAPETLIKKMDVLEIVVQLNKELDEDNSKTTEETTLCREEPRELSIPQIAVQLNKDIHKESEEKTHEEEGMAPYKMKEETEKASKLVSTSDSLAFESEGDGLIISSQTPVAEQSEGQQSTPSSALYGEDLVHETSATTVSMQDTVNEVLEDESKIAKEESLQMDEPKELEIPHLGLPLEKDKQDKNPIEVHEREISGFESETNKDTQKDTLDAHVEEATIIKVLELHPQEDESKKSISEHHVEFDKSTEVTGPLEGTSDHGTKTSEEVLKSVLEVHDHKILDVTEEDGTKKKDPDAATNGYTAGNLTERTIDTAETIHNDITNEESVEEKKDGYISHPITLVEEATKESNQEYILKAEESPTKKTTALTIHNKELHKEIETGEVDAETKTVKNFQQIAIENETFKEEKGQETSRKEGPGAFAEESAATLELDQGENTSVANSEQQRYKEAEPCAPETPIKKMDVPEIVVQLDKGKDEDNSKATEETSLCREEPRELDIPQITVQLNKDIHKESEEKAHEEEGMTPYKIEEEIEKAPELVSTSDSHVFKSKVDGLIISAQPPVAEQSEGQQSTPSSALYGEDQVHEILATTVSMEDTVKEVLEDESKTAKEASLQMDESKELEIPHLELPLEQDKQDKNPIEVHEREISGFESETNGDIQKDNPDAHVEEVMIPKILELHPQEYESKKSISEHPAEFDKSTEVTRPLEGTFDLGTKTSEEVLKSVSQVHDHKILDETEEAGTKKKDPDAATNGYTARNLAERTTDTAETIHNDITNEESVEEKKDGYISHPITLVEEATKESNQEYILKAEESPAEETTTLTIHNEELHEEIETGKVDAETKTVKNFQQTAVENETFKEEKGQETSRKEGPGAFAEESAATVKFDKGENTLVANSEQQKSKEAEPCAPETPNKKTDVPELVVQLNKEADEDNSKTTEETSLCGEEPRELDIPQIAVHLNKDIQKESEEKAHEEEGMTPYKVKEETEEASKLVPKSDSHTFKSEGDDIANSAQTSVVEQSEEQHPTPSSALHVEDQVYETSATILSVEDEVKEVEVLANESKTAEETSLQSDEPKELEISHLELPLEKDKQDENPDTKIASELLSKSHPNEFESVEDDMIISAQTPAAEQLEQQNPTSSSTLSAEDQDHGTLATVLSIEKKEAKLLQDESKREDASLQKDGLKKLEISHLELPLEKEKQDENPNEVREKENGTPNETIEEDNKATDSVFVSDSHGPKATKHDEINVAFPTQKSEDEYITPTASLVSKEQDHGTVIEIDNTEQHMIKKPASGIPPAFSVPETTEEACFPTDERVEEVRIPKVVELHPQEYESKKTDSECPAEIDKTKEVAGPLEETSNLRTKTSEEVSESVSILRDHEILDETEEAEDKDKDLESATNEFIARDMTERTADTTETMHNEIRNEDSVEEKDDANISQSITLAEEATKEGKQDNKLKAEESPGEETTTETTRNEESREEIGMGEVDAEKKTSENFQQAAVENETFKEEKGQETSEKEGTGGFTEASAAVPELDQGEKTSVTNSEQQVSKEAEPCALAESITPIKKIDVPELQQDSLIETTRSVEIEILQPEQAIVETVTDAMPMIGLEEAPIDDKKVHVSSLTFDESIPQELAYETKNRDGIALEESSSHLPSRLATGDHDNLTSENIVPQPSEESQQASERIEELVESEVTTDQAFPKGISKENHQAAPLALSPQKEDHEAKGAIEDVEENTVEMVTRKDESLDGANAEITQTSDATEQKKKEGSKCIPKSSEGIDAAKEEGTTSIQALNVENIGDQYQTRTSKLLPEDQEHGTLATTVSTEQNADKLEFQEATSKATEETSLLREETKELEVPQMVVQLNKDVQTESEKEAHEEEGMAPYKIEEVTEKASELVSTSDSLVFESEGDGGSVREQPRIQTEKGNQEYKLKAKEEKGQESSGKEGTGAFTEASAAAPELDQGEKTSVANFEQQKIDVPEVQQDSPVETTRSVEIEIPQPRQAVAETVSEDTGKFSLLEMMQRSTRERQEAAGALAEEKETATSKAEPKAETVETEEAKSDEEEGGGGGGGHEDKHKKTESSLDAPVMVEATKGMPAMEDVKAAHKKSHHNILSGVGSKVKHSISKVKKAITGKSSHPKQRSPK